MSKIQVVRESTGTVVAEFYADSADDLFRDHWTEFGNAITDASPDTQDED